MDSFLRQQFLQLLGMDLAAVDLNDEGVRGWSGQRFEIRGPSLWPRTRAWWLG